MRGPLRIAVISARNFSRAAFQCGQLEAQDVLAECEDVDLICVEAEPGFHRKQQWLRRLMYRDVSRKLAYFNPGLKRVTLTKDYDVLIVMAVHSNGGLARLVESSTSLCSCAQARPVACGAFT